jgi:hypothetical protein
VNPIQVIERDIADLLIASLLDNTKEDIRGPAPKAV